jgi:hypothetical protein
MKPEGSLPCSQEPSTGPYPEPDQSSPYHPILSNPVKVNKCSWRNTPLPSSRWKSINQARNQHEVGSEQSEWFLPASRWFLAWLTLSNELDLCRLLPCQVQNPMPISYCLGCVTESPRECKTFHNILVVSSGELLAPTHPKLEDHPLSTSLNILLLTSISGCGLLHL